MATTVNGFTVLETGRTAGALPRLRKFLIPGTGRHLVLRDGSIGFLLVHLALWFHETIERLDLGIWDEWGHAVRPVRGQDDGYSNHAAGAAEDLNATRHPLGVPTARTFTAKQIRAIKLRLLFYRGLIIWGGTWRRPDAMHFEAAQRPLKTFEFLARVLANSPRGKRILIANPGLREVIFS